jgi:hypothetical protein
MGPKKPQDKSSPKERQESSKDVAKSPQAEQKKKKQETGAMPTFLISFYKKKGTKE